MSDIPFNGPVAGVKIGRVDGQFIVNPDLDTLEKSDLHLVVAGTDDAVKDGPENEPERGINFIALGANIARQFEFVQSAWLMSTTFDALVGESDPLMGTREKTTGCPFSGNFTFRAGSSVRRRITLPQFVTVRAGGYFFLPGLRALRFIARCAENS